MIPLLFFLTAAVAYLLGWSCAQLGHRVRSAEELQDSARRQLAALDDAYTAGIVQGVQAGLQSGLAMRVTTIRAQRRGTVCGLN